jgi:tetratricopeptide (TPR) repeat protein
VRRARRTARLRPPFAAGVAALALAGSAALACAGAEAGPGLAAVGPAGLSEVARTCPAAQPEGADVAALGLTNLTLVARGQDLGALAAIYERVRDSASGAIAVVVADGVAEVAGRDACAEVGWARVVSGGGRVRLWAMTDVTRVQLALGWAALEAGQGPEARVAFAAAGAEEPALPDAGLAIARSYVVEERFTEAAAAYQDLVARFAGNPVPQAGLGEALRRLGRRSDAAAAWARALALWPRNGALLRQAGADPYVELAPPVAPPALRLPDGRWAYVNAPAGAPETIAAASTEASVYATCKEAFRTTPAVRTAAGVTGETWRWSPAEESVCTAVWLRAYQQHRDGGRVEEAPLDDLLRIAQAGFLDERALFDVGAPAHPLAPALLDAGSRARLQAFAAAHRLMPRRQGGWLF